MLPSKSRHPHTHEADESPSSAAAATEKAPAPPIASSTALPPLSPSSEALLESTELLIPEPTYSPVDPTKKSHARKQPAGHIPRPRNAFILFRCDFVRQKMIPTSKESDHRKISRLVGAIWTRMTDDEKAPWVRMAEQEKAAHFKAHPGYRFSRTVNNTARAMGKKARHLEDATSTRGSMSPTEHTSTPRPLVREPLYLPTPEELDRSALSSPLSLYDQDIPSPPLLADSAFKSSVYPENDLGRRASSISLYDASPYGAYEPRGVYTPSTTNGGQSSVYDNSRYTPVPEWGSPGYSYGQDQHSGPRLNDAIRGPIHGLDSPEDFDSHSPVESVEEHAYLEREGRTPPRRESIDNDILGMFPQLTTLPPVPETPGREEYDNSFQSPRSPIERSAFYSPRSGLYKLPPLPGLRSLEGPSTSMSANSSHHRSHIDSGPSFSDNHFHDELQHSFSDGYAKSSSTSSRGPPAPSWPFDSPSTIRNSGNTRGLDDHEASRRDDSAYWDSTSRLPPIDAVRRKASSSTSKHPHRD